MKKIRLISSAFVLLLFIVSCTKEPGPGGKATVKGKLKVQNYNSSFTVLQDTYYAAGKNIYIIYGDETAVGDNIDTAPDGSFEFRFLRKGKYKIFAVSKDKDHPTYTGTISITKDVEITDKKQTVDIGDLVVYD